MDVITSVAPASMVPVRHRGPEDGSTAAFDLFFDGRDAPARQAKAPPELAIKPAQWGSLSALGAACAAAAGPASAEAVERVVLSLREDPSVASAARIERGAHGFPLDGFPAVASAAMQGADPLGWVDLLLELGVDFDAAKARSQARLELFENAHSRAGDLGSLSLRCDALSIWTMNCAQAQHPSTALKAIARARLARPGGLAPLSSDLAKFDVDRAWDHPAIDLSNRTRIFLEAGWPGAEFFSSTLPGWIAGSRGTDLLAFAQSIARSATASEARQLSEALGALDGEGSVRAFLKTFQTQLHKLDEAAGESNQPSSPA